MLKIRKTYSIVWPIINIIFCVCVCVHIIYTYVARTHTRTAHAHIYITILHFHFIIPQWRSLNYLLLIPVCVNKLSMCYLYSDLRGSVKSIYGIRRFIYANNIFPTIFFLQYKLLTLKVLIKETSEQHTIMKLFAKLPIN